MEKAGEKAGWQVHACNFGTCVTFGVRRSQESGVWQLGQSWQGRVGLENDLMVDCGSKGELVIYSFQIALGEPELNGAKV